MIDQTFSAENFRLIFDLENRKGNDLVARFFPPLVEHTQRIKSKSEELRELRRQRSVIDSATFAIALSGLKRDIAQLKADKSAAIDAELTVVSERVLKPDFKVALTQRIGPKGKPVYTVDGTAESFFVVKQLQKNLNRLYAVKQSNRHDQVRRVRDMIQGTFPFELIRADVSDFYESIDRRSLVARLDSDKLLSPSSHKFLKQVLDSYERLTGSVIGVPRGIGVSAYLAELYLQSVDESIKELPGLVIYCRYVDDIVALFARPPLGRPLPSYQESVADILTNAGLTMNPKKSTTINLGTGARYKFEFLGYRFRRVEGSNLLEISPSAAKIRKYRSRVNAAFTCYYRDRPIQPKSAFRELVARIKFLTGNTRLANSKSTAVVGVYYTNSLVNHLGYFERLDKVLKRQVLKLRSPALRRRLKQFKFTKGFSNRVFHRFSTKALQMIVRAWKHGQA